MFIREVTSPQDQLNLLKRIIDSTWSAISAEAAAAAAAKQQRAAAAATKPLRRRAVAPATKPAARASTAPTANNSGALANKASDAEKTAAAIVQRGTAQTQLQQQPQSRRVYPSSTAKPKPIARLGRVAAVPNTEL